MQIEECNFNFTYIKIRHSSALPSLGSLGRKESWGEGRIRKGGSRREGGGGGWNAPLGLVGKRFPSSWAVAAALENVAPLRALTLLEPPLPWLVSRARGKPGENQSPKLEYKPISGGVRGLRTPCASSGERGREKERRRGEARDEILKEAALSNRESNLHTLHKRDTNWRGREEMGEG